MPNKLEFFHLYQIVKYFSCLRISSFASRTFINTLTLHKNRVFDRELNEGNVPGLLVQLHCILMKTTQGNY